ncbi:hypothetical protein B296_00057798, partial [Ensete ventricosum]
VRIDKSNLGYKQGLTYRSKPVCQLVGHAAPYQCTDTARRKEVDKEEKKCSDTCEAAVASKGSSSITAAKAMLLQQRSRETRKRQHRCSIAVANP